MKAINVITKSTHDIYHYHGAKYLMLPSTIKKFYVLTELNDYNASEVPESLRTGYFAIDGRIYNGHFENVLPGTAVINISPRVRQVSLFEQFRSDPL